MRRCAACQSSLLHVKLSARSVGAMKLKSQKRDVLHVGSSRSTSLLPFCTCLPLSTSQLNKSKKARSAPSSLVAVGLDLLLDGSILGVGSLLRLVGSKELIEDLGLAELEVAGGDSAVVCSAKAVRSAVFDAERTGDDLQTRRTVSTSSIDCVLTSASCLILAVTSLTWSSVISSSNCSTRDLTAFQPVKRDPISMYLDNPKSSGLRLCTLVRGRVVGIERVSEGSEARSHGPRTSRKLRGWREWPWRGYQPCG